MSRILARECGFKLVYQYLFDKKAKEEFIFDEYNLDKEDKNFSSEIFNSLKNNYSNIENKIKLNLKNNLNLTDLYKVDLAILITAIAEIDYLKESISLVINQAVELAKKYSTDNSPKFINGFLASVYGKKEV